MSALMREILGSVGLFGAPTDWSASRSSDQLAFGLRSGHYHRTAFVPFSIQGLKDFLSLPKPYSTASECAVNCQFPGQNSLLCDPCNRRMDRSDEKIGAGAVAALADDDSTNPDTEPSCEEQGNCCQDDGTCPAAQESDEDGMLRPPSRVSPTTSHAQPGKNFNCEDDTFIGTGQTRILVSDYPDLCLSDGTHGLLSDCAQSSMEAAQKSCEDIEACKAVTGQKGTYYLRDGFGKRSSLPGWVACGRELQAGAPPENHSIKWSIMDAHTVG